jgi:hypothetical protein
MFDREQPATNEHSAFITPESFVANLRELSGNEAVDFIQEQVELLSTEPPADEWTTIQMGEGEFAAFARLPFRESEIEAIGTAMQAHEGFYRNYITASTPFLDEFIRRGIFFPASAEELQDRATAVEKMISTARVAYLLGRGYQDSIEPEEAAWLKELQSLPDHLIAHDQ